MKAHRPDYEIINISSDVLPNNAYTSSIVFDPHDANHIVVSFCNYSIKSIFSTLDGGNHWINVSGNLEEYHTGAGSGPAVYWVAILPENGSNTYFAGTTTGLYSTSDLFAHDDPEGKGTQWFREGITTLGNVRVQHIVTREIDGEVVLATHGTGVWSRDFSFTAIDENNEPLVPDEFELKQNYPNPFNPTTTINYSIPHAANVLLKTYNYLGKEIKTLVNEFQSAGNKSVVWDGIDNNGKMIISGVYLYKLDYENQSILKKMILLK